MRFRRTRLGRLYADTRPARWTNRLSRPRGWALARGGWVWLTLAGILMTSVAATSGAASAAVAAGVSRLTRPAALRATTRPGLATAAASAAGGAAVSGAAATGSASRAVAATHATPLRTSCRSVAHIGDSTSVDLVSSADLPDPAQQLPARYTDVGVRHLLLDASGGRSIVETLPGQVNGYNVALNWWNRGYRGCWVFALGTNDTANVSSGGSPGLAARIDEMMSVAHGEPVLWVNTVTQLSSGPWSDANEQAWDNALVSALRSYPNMRILDWAALAQPGWFLPDGIHYDPLGCAIRAQTVADGLARAFPRDGHSPGQIVR